jgi:hypothetical protein
MAATIRFASLVPDRPYFEDAQYCLRLISIDGTELSLFDERVSPTTPFRIEREFVVAVTVNPSSPFRQPTPVEQAPCKGARPASSAKSVMRG